MLFAVPTASLAANPQQVTSVRLVDGTPATLSPNAFLANLDAGDLVAGNTRWDHDGDGVFFNEGFIGFLWSPTAGLQVMELPERQFLRPFFHLPSEIASNAYVVGTRVDRETFVSTPFLWTPAGGTSDLPITRNWTGAANAIAAGGTVAGGEMRNGIGAATPTQAVRWTISGLNKPRARLFQLATGEAWSTALDVSANGAVIVGAAGPAASVLQATRWVEGTRQALQAVGSASRARFTSSDGAIALGTAEVGGRTVLVRWLADGSASSFAPAAGDSIRELAAANPSASAAVGQLDVAGNPAPFVWTLAQGFVVIPELGRELDYDFSRATDVSDDGDTVVGNFGATVVVEGDPPQLGFVWTRSGGVALVDDLLVAGGFGDLGVYEVPALSGDGSRFLATGDPPRTPFDTNSFLVTLQP